MKKTFSSLFLFAGMVVVSANIQAQIITTIAGTGTAGYNGASGRADTMQVNSPVGIAADNSGNVYFADESNQVIRKISTSGMITTVAGIAGSSGYNGDSLAATRAKLNSPLGVAVDASGNLYIADNGNFIVRKIDTGGIITKVAGTGGISGFGYSGDGGAATSAHLYAYGLAVDRDQNIYIADGNSAIRKVDHTTGMITTIAGSSALGFSGDGGPAISASLSNPTGVAVDTSGNIYIADYTNNRLRVVNTAATPVIATLAGTGPEGFSGDGGIDTNAKLSQPYGVAVDVYGNIYIADFGNKRVREIAIPDTINTIAGGGTSALGDGGPAVASHLTAPYGVCVDGNRNVYIADQIDNRIRKISGHVALNLCVGSSAPTGFSIPGGTWVDPAPGIAALDVTTGMVTGVDTGSTIISYTVGIDTVTALVTVNQPLSAGSITGTDSLCAGDTLALTDSAAGGVWTSANTAIATIAAPGMVAGVTPGYDTVVYTVSHSGCLAVASFVVKIDSSTVCHPVAEGVSQVITTGNRANIFPNPAHGSFTVAFPDAKGKTTVVISDVYGRLTAIQETSGTQLDFDLRNAAKGIYLVKIQNGAAFETQHLVLE